MSADTTVVLDGGSVEYDIDKASADIDAVISALEEAKKEGATHVVLPSGNSRGAQWMTLHPSYDWAGE
jgi:predicted alpha/beta hydrolase